MNKLKGKFVKKKHGVDYVVVVEGEISRIRKTDSIRDVLVALDDESGEYQWVNFYSDDHIRVSKEEKKHLDSICDFAIKYAETHDIEKGGDRAIGEYEIQNGKWHLGQLRIKHRK
jgi:hypothetical protein